MVRFPRSYGGNLQLWMSWGGRAGSYPAWLNALSMAFPMRYAVHALRNLLLKGVGFGTVLPDFLFMGAFAAVMLVTASTLFKRTL